jgi:alkaline phosphatase D
MLLIFFIISSALSLPIETSKSISKIAFGSCNHNYNYTNPTLWKSVLSFHPDLFLWLGDAIYADRGSFPFSSKITSPTIWKAKYDTVKSTEYYRDLIQTSMITGIWDDHDYGMNDADKNFKLKHESKELYLSFIDEPVSSPRRSRDGLYTSYKFGAKGKQLHLILLDDRWFYDKQARDVLGEEQWQFLEEELKNPGDLVLIANGIQILPSEDIFKEHWYTSNRERLYQLVKGIPVLLLSGDVHFAEIMKNECTENDIYEVTSSGITHTLKSLMGPVMVWITNLVKPFTYNISTRTFEKNFATIEIQWEEDPKISVDVRNQDGDSLLELDLKRSDLLNKSPRKAICDQNPIERLVKHAVSVAGVFGVPALLNVLGVYIFLRKYTNKE